MELEKYINPEVIRLDVTGRTKDDVIREMTAVLCQAHGLADYQMILDTIHKREQDRSTGMGNGVAIPHARTDMVKNILVSLGRCREGIDWSAPDFRPVQFVFLVVGPQKASEDYLHVLADISRLMSRALVRKGLLEAQTPAAVLKIIGENRVRESRI